MFMLCGFSAATAFQRCHWPVIQPNTVSFLWDSMIAYNKISAAFGFILASATLDASTAHKGKESRAYLLDSVLLPALQNFLI